MSPLAPSPRLASRLWIRYTTALRERPLRTKMIQSGVLFVSADMVAQFGIEGRGMGGLLRGEEGEGVWDPLRTARLTLYGASVFAPLAHFWLTNLEKIHMTSRVYTLASKVTLDCLVWSPFVTFMFPTTLGLLEGKSVNEVKTKVAMGWFPTWQKAVCVFGPTQIINFTLVPAPHRFLTVQSVGLCWNIFLSWQNNRNNKLLAAATVRLAEAHLHADLAADGVPGEDLEKREREVGRAEEDVRRAAKRKEEMRKQGGELGVGVRMGWS
ncbi:hypothetical protein IAT38_006837 [Cryptococcus sp. DSM 104549]